jgi:hypothetical protein
VPGVGAEFNQNLEKAGRVADFLEFGELMCLDALTRDESCGGHFREEHQTDDGEALRDDALRPRRRVGVQGRGQTGPGAAQGAARVRTRPPRHPRATSEEDPIDHDLTMKLKIWRQKDRQASPGKLETYKLDACLPGHVVPRDARRAQRDS